MNKPIFFLDMDGCLASQGKIWHERYEEAPGCWPGKSKVLTVSKQISDHDSYSIDMIKDKSHVIIISGDERINRAWAERRGVDFIFTAGGGFHEDKIEHLRTYVKENGLEGQDYYYLGDTPPDYRCMVNAKRAFYPKDAALSLRDKCDIHGHITRLSTNSGCGVFDEMLHVLIVGQHLPDEFV